MFRKNLLSAVLVTALAGGSCALASEPGPAVRIHRYATTDASWGVNAYWLESDKGIVVVDALLLESDVRGLIGAIRSTGKPVVGILVTHAHVDHFGGLPVLREAFGAVPVYSTQGTADGVEPVLRRARAGAWSKPFGTEFPKEAVVPDQVQPSGELFELAGMKFRFRDMGPMETTHNSVLENLDTGALFTGDATVFHAAYYIGEGHSCQVLQGLSSLAASYPATTIAYSGHYDPAPLHMVLAGNTVQVRAMRKLMADALADPANREAEGGLKESVRSDLTARAAKLLAGQLTYGFGAEAAAAELNLPGLESEMRRELKDGKSCPVQD